MARSIVRTADAFLLDEPLSNLDAKVRGQVGTEIVRMQRRLDSTTVYVTHDRTAAVPAARSNTRVTLVAVVFAALVLAFTASARWLGGVYVTAPIAFVVAGAVISAVTPSTAAESAEGIKVVAELTLALILFHDAAQVRPRQIEADRGLVIRLLLVGLPLTVLVGFLAARLAFPAMPVMVALLLAAALSPTDAGLGAATVLNPVVPVRIRRILNVESGLNDGLITPVVLFAISATAGEEGLGVGVTVVNAVLDLGVGAVLGAVIGAGGGLLLGWSRRHDLSTASTRSLGVLVLPILAYCVVALAGGNSFVAAFVAGTAFTASASWVDQEESALDRTDALSELLGFAVWLVFGVAALPLIRDHIGWRELVFAVLSLTVFRMLPVALSLIGSGLRARTVAFIGWFGPRGLASVVFALLAVEDLEIDDQLRTAISTIAMTVLLSVILHGLTADMFATRFGAWVDRENPPAETAPATEPRVRRSLVPRWHSRS